MEEENLILLWISLLIPLFTALFSFIYGLRHFFKKGKPLFLQSLTLAMGSHALGSVYQLCLSAVGHTTLDGFIPTHLGRMGFFLFLLTASYGQLDRIVDDRTPPMRPAQWIALVAPVCAALLYIPIWQAEGVSIETKMAYAVVWLPCVFSVYYNGKHAIIPDLDFNFIKAIRPYNLLAVCLSFAELICLITWQYLSAVAMAVAACAFGALCLCTVVAARKGVEKWTI